jgi:hypothetical protein
MALSNWDTLAANEKGAPISGSFKSPMGVVVEIYKNWIYLHDAKAWEKGAFTEDVVARITEGCFQYKDVSILTLRGPQEGVFVVAWSGAEYSKNIQGIVGCGVYGYENSEWKGVLPETVKWFNDKLNEKEQTSLDIGDGPVYEDAYVLDVPRVFRVIELNGGLRYNQGDKYFADKLGIDVPATSPGEADKSILSRIVNEIL